MMKADVTAENRPAYPPRQNNQYNNQGVYAKKGKNTHKDQRGVQVFIVLLHKVAVVPVGFTLELIVELATGAARCSVEVLREGR